ncbi:MULTISPECIES: ATP-binding protein [unclassified Gordonia (in: high G+C Gram-positive bacteria)]|uniref:ATP-binding protein n=1 Tax=unclassified Gordonia (in: high G+C Gram-positive bacteria) TaxID=2657482 RepID=UPI0008155221|nr:MULTISPECIES: AAA family ATPase [unclassified Gordonia (in: high G+C Gram-positive bacteria)]SCC61112.1 transitional endoplasmic reticulum ATPase [Gordonia sp. v-85]
MTEIVEVDDIFIGAPALVTAVSIDGLRVDFRLPNGKVGNFTNSQPVDLATGDVILINEEASQYRKSDLTKWPEPTKIGVVRHILEAGVLVDDSFTPQLIPNREPGTTKLGQTVEFGEVGVHRVLSDKPLLPQRVGSDDVNPVQYLWEDGEDDLTFDDFGGYPDVVARARELIEIPLERERELKSIGARPIKGVLFTGPPGTGKTHLARIIANQSDASFYSVSGPEIISKWVGDSEGNLRALFEEAASKERAIIFFDEIDSLAEERSGDTHEASKRVVAQLLTLMDGFQTKNSNIIVIAATNRPDDVDRALRRPGRFDWRIEFPTPSVTDRLEILRVSMKHLNVKEPDAMPLAQLASQTEGWSAARLTLLWTEAALIAATDARDSLRTEDLMAAFERLNERSASSEKV